MTIPTISTIEAKEDFSELVSRIAHNKERVIITRRGKEVAALVPIHDLQLLLQAENKSDLNEALEALKEARKSGTFALHDLNLDTD